MKDFAAKTAHEAQVLVGVRFDQGDPIDETLAQVARELSGRGHRVAGLLQTRGKVTSDCACAEMRLHDLATGNETLISEKRGPAARGCHLDWQAMSGLSNALEESLTADTDVLIINRFGRSESEGMGFRRAIEKAIMLGVRVIVGYRLEYEEHWDDFHGGLAMNCPAAVQDIVALSDPC